MPTKKTIGLLLPWIIIAWCLILAAATYCWYDEKIKSIDQKIENIENK